MCFTAVADARIVPQFEIKSSDLENVQLKAFGSKVQEEDFDESIEARNPVSILNMFYSFFISIHSTKVN